MKLIVPWQGNFYKGILGAQSLFLSASQTRLSIHNNCYVILRMFIITYLEAPKSVGSQALQKVKAKVVTREG